MCACAYDYWVGLACKTTVKQSAGNSGHSVLCVKIQRRTNLNYACTYSVVVVVCLEEILGCYTLESSSGR